MSVLSVREQAQKSEHIEMGGMPRGVTPNNSAHGLSFSRLLIRCNLQFLYWGPKGASGCIMRLDSPYLPLLLEIDTLEALFVGHHFLLFLRCHTDSLQATLEATNQCSHNLTVLHSGLFISHCVCDAGGGVKKAAGHGVITIIKSQCTPFSSRQPTARDAENKACCDARRNSVTDD